jgi:protein-arginine deiminase
VAPHTGSGRSYKWLTPNQILADAKMVQDQNAVQAKIDACLQVLLRELGLDTDDVVELPILFTASRRGTAIAYTPGVVNMLVVTRDGHTRAPKRKVDGKAWRGNRSKGSFASTATQEKLSTSAVCCVPKPFGPVVGGICQFEKAVEERLSQIGLDTQFVDDLWCYHVLEGEVHCGTNTLRTAPKHERWWEVEPPA